MDSWVTGCLARGTSRGKADRLGVACVGLGVAAAVCVLLTAIQLLPVMEFTQQSLRAAESSPHDIYPFSIEPLRLAGLIWPDVLGANVGRDTFWGDLLSMPGGPARVWVPSLYIGILTVVLAAGALAFRRGSPWRVWLSVIAVVSVLASLGQYTSPIWSTRALATGTRWEPLQRLVAHLGPLDPDDTAALREDWYLRDGDGSFYWWLLTFLPGFRQFRYPAKLFTFTTLALAALAGIGWDSLRAGARRRISAMIGGLLAVTAACLAVVLVGRHGDPRRVPGDQLHVDLRAIRPPRRLRGADPQPDPGDGRAGDRARRDPAGPGEPAAAAVRSSWWQRPPTWPGQPPLRADGPPVHLRDDARDPAASSRKPSEAAVRRPLSRPPAARVGAADLAANPLAAAGPGDRRLGA